MPSPNGSLPTMKRQLTSHWKTVEATSKLNAAVPRAPIQREAREQDRKAPSVSFTVIEHAQGPNGTHHLKRQLSRHWKVAEAASKVSTAVAKTSSERSGSFGRRSPDKRSPISGWRVSKRQGHSPLHGWGVVGAISRVAFAFPTDSQLQREIAIEAEQERRAAIAQRKHEFAKELTRKTNRRKEIERAHYATLHANLKSMERRTVNPTGRRMMIWDRMMLFAMIWTALITPFEVSFMTSDASSNQPTGVAGWALFSLNRVIDLIFIFDLVLTFFVPYRQSPRKGGRWVYDRQKIAKRYLSTWFALDALTAVPTDLLLLLDVGSMHRLVRKVIRGIRILKLARLVRLSRIMRRLLSRSYMDPSLLALLKFFVITMMTAHWLACVWGFAGNNFSNNAPIDLDEWYVEDYLRLSWVQKHQMTNASPMHLTAPATLAPSRASSCAR